MPSGLPDLLTRAEFVDLLRFLSELGRPGPYAVPDLPIVRRWRVARGLGERPATPPLEWAPATSEVSGTLPRSELGTGRFAVLEFEVEATTSGLAKITLDPMEGVTPGFGLDPGVLLRPGRQKLSVVVDVQAFKAPGLKITLGEVPGSPARFRVIHGN